MFTHILIGAVYVLTLLAHPISIPLQGVVSLNYYTTNKVVYVITRPLTYVGSILLTPEEFLESYGDCPGGFTD